MGTFTNRFRNGLCTVAVLLAASRAAADESPLAPVLTKVASTTLSGYVDVSGEWSLSEGSALIPGRSLSVWHRDFSTTDAQFTAPVNIVVVPEPSVASLAVLGGATLLLRRRLGTGLAAR